jgi:sugar-specific transcriptional regulator TrmB
MEELNLPPLISDEIAKVYLKQMIEIVKKELKGEITSERLPLDQKALMKKFGFDHGYIKKLERRGLAFRKQGKKKMYDVRDVYEILEQEKEYLK